MGTYRAILYHSVFCRRCRRLISSNRSICHRCGIFAYTYDVQIDINICKSISYAKCSVVGVRHYFTPMTKSLIFGTVVSQMAFAPLEQGNDRWRGWHPGPSGSGMIFFCIFTVHHIISAKYETSGKGNIERNGTGIRCRPDFGCNM